MLELTWGAGTHTGLRRKRNEDAHLAAPPLFVVADGMGGHERGDVAAQLAVRKLAEVVGTATTRAGVLDAVRAADREIWSRSGADTERAMGTTLCGLICLPDDAGQTVLVFNVGDSRVYRRRGGQLEQLTHDHSVVQELIDEGHIQPHEAETHPERNVITRSLGSGDPVDVDWWSVEAAVGDTFLLCSDGLVKEVALARITAVLTASSDPQARADQLIAEALSSGGRDNVTVVVVEVTGASTVDAMDLDGPTGERLSGPVVDTNPRFAPPPDPPTRSEEASPGIVSPTAAVTGSSAVRERAGGPAPADGGTTRGASGLIDVDDVPT